MPRRSCGAEPAGSAATPLDRLPDLREVSAESKSRHGAYVVCLHQWGARPANTHSADRRADSLCLRAERAEQLTSLTGWSHGRVR